MHKVVLIIFGLVLAGSVSAKESIQGHYDVVGNVPAAHSLKKVVYEEFMNFGCSHCNNLHKASRNFRENICRQSRIYRHSDCLPWTG